MSARRLLCSAFVMVAGVLVFASAPALAAAPEAPQVTVESPVSAGSATVDGVLDPKREGEAGSYEFLYKQGKAGCSGGLKAPEPAGAMTGLEDQPVSEVISNLASHTEYTVCLLVETTEGLAESSVVFTTALAPEAPETTEANPVAASTASLHGVLNPNVAREFEPGSYEFHYRQSASECEGGEPGEEKTTIKTAASGHPKEAVQAQVTELLAGMPYTFCLVARDDAGELAVGSPVTFTTPSTFPTVESEFTANVANTSATLGAKIDPGGTETTYHFEYGTTASYGQSTAESGLAGSGDTVQSAEAHIQGLQANTVYHYRAIATNSHSPVGGTPGPDRTFTTQQVGGELQLPDGRIWELVSPADSEGANAFDYELVPLQAAADGHAITYPVSKSTEYEPPGNASGNRVLSWRGPDGWSTREIDIPHKETVPVLSGDGEEYRYFSTDLAHAIVEPIGSFDPLLSAEATERTPYLRSDFTDNELGEACVSSCYRPLVTAANVPPGTKFGGNNQNPPPIEFFPAVNVISMTHDMSSIVLASGAALTRPASPTGEYVWTAGRIEPLPGEFLAIVDGRVLFSEGSGIAVLDIVTDESRLLVSEASFAMVNGDGSQVFFTKGDHYFQVEVENGQVTDLTPGREVRINSVERFGRLYVNAGIVGHSDDGSYLYFDGVVNGQEAEYVLHESSPEWTIAVVPGLSEASASQVPEHGNRATPVVSPNGRYLTFRSGSDLTGYDNQPAEPEDCGTTATGSFRSEACGEVYLYDAVGGKLACVSCNPTAERPSGESYLEGPHTDGLVGPLTSQPRDVSDSGRVFFNSSDALVPQDVDGTQDVYEYEPAGVGSCTVADSTFGEKSGGCTSLLSAGTSPQESTFLDASESGGDVFLLTTAKLSLQDPGEEFVVYDTHECTSDVPCHQPQVGSPPCDTEASCRPGPTPQPAVYGAPSSATFSGSGNIAQVSTPSVKARSKSPTREQKLARALKACKKKPKGKRAACEKRARRSYGSAAKAKKSLKEGK